MEFILILIAAISNAIMDRSALNQLWGNWWNKSNSWRNKWKKNKKGNLISNNKRLWYYLWLYKPSYVELFPYSSTIFVWTTDAWHLFQMFMLSCFQLGISLNIKFIYLNDNFYNELLEFLALKTLFSLVFQVFYKKIKYV